MTFAIPKTALIVSVLGTQPKLLSRMFSAGTFTGVIDRKDEGKA